MRQINLFAVFTFGKFLLLSESFMRKKQIANLFYITYFRHHIIYIMIFFKKYFTPVFLFAFAISLNCFAANDAVPVMLRVVTAKQDLSRGYNFVEQFNNLIYDEIIAGHANLWDSPSKEIQLTAASLQDIEKSTGTSFRQQPNIFVYEKWTKAATEIQTTTIGFSFINKNQKGEDIAYGYVEFNEVSEALLRTVLSVNADGNCNLRIGYALQTKQFDFSIIQFDGEAITSETASEKIKKDFVAGMGFNSVLFPLQKQTKCITYILEQPVTLDDPSSKLTGDIIKTVQTFLAEHAVTFSDWGSDLLKDINSPADIQVTRIEVQETWNKHAGNITTQLKQVLIYIKGQPLNAITPDDLAGAEIMCNSKELSMLLKEKKMLYYISRINDQAIERINTFPYLKALKETDWNLLNEYVAKKQ